MIVAQTNDAELRFNKESKTCFHCLETLPKYSSVFANIDGQEKPVCCHGCKSAAEFISSKGLVKFYQHRERSGARAQIGKVVVNKDVPLKDVPITKKREQNQWRFLDSNLDEYSLINEDGTRDLQIIVQGLYCSSCSWLIEKALHKLDSDIRVNVELDAKRINISLPPTSKSNGKQIRISELFQLIDHLGYQPTPQSITAADDDLTELRKNESRQAIKRIAVAGFGMMQLMTYAVALYLGAVQGMDQSIDRFLTLVSMVVATAVVFYSGKPFFSNAFNDLKNGHFGMDVPIALAIAGAYFPSVYNVLAKTGGHVYFDSAVMFVFFLLIGRYVEMRARHRLSAAPHALMNLLPAWIQVERHSSKKAETHNIKVKEVALGDQMSLSTGATVPFDARVLAGVATLDESLVTGEARGVVKHVGDYLVAGSRLVSGSISIGATRKWSDSSIVKIERMLRKSNAQLPQNFGSLQKFSRVFVVVVLILTLATSIFWWFYQPHRVFEVALAMLIASCPCAFALAAPVSTTAATRALRRVGVLLSSPKALTLFSQISLWCFDKTGTLTQGKTNISNIETEGNLDAQKCLEIIASIEKHSHHALANAFTNIPTSLAATEVVELPGRGISAMIDGEKYRVGKRSWIENSLASVPINKATNGNSMQDSEVVLANATRVLATVSISDELRSGAISYLQHLAENNKQSLILSGDRQAVVDVVATQLMIDSAFGDLLPEQKLSVLKVQQANGNRVAMVGDGVNDAPVLSQADLSIALASGSELSQSQADVLLLNGDLNRLTVLESIADLTKRVTQQNLAWALAYNALVLPLAASGNLTPWIAAIGMSSSSLLVVLNALRITKHKTIKKSGVA